MNDETHVWATAYAAAFAAFYSQSASTDQPAVVAWAHEEAVKVATLAVNAWRLA